MDGLDIDGLEMEYPLMSFLKDISLNHCLKKKMQLRISDYFKSDVKNHSE